MIVIPSSAWRRLIGEFLKTGPALERVGYFDGVRNKDIGVVTTVVIPEAELHPRYYRVSADAMSAAGQHLRRYDLVRLAQVHTHGGVWTGHSKRDDERAYSQRPGALSIVLPDHGLCCPGLGDAGVHLRERGGWRELAPDEVLERIRLVPDFLDFRPE
jgi:hypothetical protein